MKKSLSIVVPCYNEEDTIEGSYVVLKDLCQKWLSKGLISKYELLFINDGSKDKTIEILSKIYNKDESVTIVDLRKNFGFQNALTAGLFEAKGDMVVSIDADLQDDPHKIEEMIEKHYEGYDMVLGVRKNRDSDTFFKRLFAQTYYKLIAKMGVFSVYNHADFRLLSRSLVEDLKKFPERVRYLRSLIFEIENHYACVYYDRVPRKTGYSKFSFSKSFSLALDGITSFTSKPIRLLFVLGMIMFLFSIVAAIVVIWAKLYLNTVVYGWASLAIIVLFFSGIQNLSLGVVGEYISKIFIENKQRPIYLVRKKYERD